MPARRRQSAVFGTMTGRPGSTLLRKGRSNIQPRRTAPLTRTVNPPVRGGICFQAAARRVSVLDFAGSRRASGEGSFGVGAALIGWPPFYTEGRRGGRNAEAREALLPCGGAA